MGNSCLKGARKCLSETDAVPTLQYLKEHAEEISLSEDKLFQELYDGLFQALYVPNEAEEEEKEFIPLI